MWFALVLASTGALLSACGPFGEAGGKRVVQATPRVLYIEDRTFEREGRDAMGTLRRRVERQLPQEPIEWLYATTLPWEGRSIEALIAAHRPDIVVFANDSFIDGLAGQSVSVPLLASSARPAANLLSRYAAFRQTNDLAIVSWQLADPERALDAIARIRGTPLRSVLALADNDVIEAGELAPLEEVAKRRALSLEILPYESYAEFSEVFARRAVLGSPDAAYLPITHQLLVHIADVPSQAIAHRVATVHSRADQVAAGGLLAVDAPSGEVFNQLARYLILMLHGVKGSSLPIGTPTRGELSVNLSAAQALGYTVPYELLVEAGEIHR